LEIIRGLRARWVTVVLVASTIVGTIALIVGVGVLGSAFYTSIFSAPVLVGAGDIATCPSTGDEDTAALLDGIDGTVFTLGDNAYPDGTDADFQNCYEPSWGRHKSSLLRTRTYPTPGNHEYHTPGASGYFDYFGAVAGDSSEGYYSYNLGGWHIVVLNSACENVGGCGDDSPMLEWLKNDLATNPQSCTLAYWHHPLFSSGNVHGNDTKMRPAWDALYAAGADVVLSAHEHVYERFAPQSPSGAYDPQGGIREFVVGTGGADLYGWGTIQPNSEVRNNTAHGVLKLTLNATSYDWEFVPVADETFTDSGSGSCH
jgi:acid phosphatase type 7